MIQSIVALDTRVLEALYAQRDSGTVMTFIGITELGSTVVVCGLALCIGLVLALRRRIAMAVGPAISVLGAGATALLLKELVLRARPDLFYQAYRETGFSFPSAHATLAAAFYGFLIYLAWRLIPSKLWRAVTTGVLCLLIALISFSRLYLGVHYVSDVAGGLILGGLFVWGTIVVVRRLELRGY